MVHHRRGVLFVGIAVLTLSIVGAGTAWAQDAVLRGKISSDRGEPVSGANVVVEELRMSASTNATGEYSLVVPGARVRGQQVVVRARGIGFKPSSKAITLTPGEQTVDLTLPYDVNLLEARGRSRVRTSSRRAGGLARSPQSCSAGRPRSTPRDAARILCTSLTASSSTAICPTSIPTTSKTSKW